MLIEPTQPASVDEDPRQDRTMLLLQYLTALVAVAAAGLLGFIH